MRNRFVEREQNQYKNQGRTFLLGLLVQGGHLGADVTGRDHVSALADALLGDGHVHGGGQQGDHHVGAAHELGQAGVVVGEAVLDEGGLAVAAEAGPAHGRHQVLRLRLVLSGDHHLLYIESARRRG